MKKISIYIIKLYILFIGIYSYAQSCNNISFDNGTQGWHFYLLESGDYPNGDSFLTPTNANTDIINNSYTYETGNINVLTSVNPTYIPNWFSMISIPNQFNSNFLQGNLDDSFDNYYSTLSRNIILVNSTTDSNYKFTGVVLFRQEKINPNDLTPVEINNCINNKSFFNFKISTVSTTTINPTTFVNLIISPDHEIFSNGIITTTEITDNIPSNYRAIRYIIDIPIQDIVDYCDQNSELIIESITSQEAFPQDTNEGIIDVCCYHLSSSMCTTPTDSNYTLNSLINMSNPQSEDQYCINTAYNLVEPSFNATPGTGVYTVTCNGNNCPAGSYNLTTNNCTFNLPGNYTVTYTYTGNNGCVITRSRNINIIDCPITPCQYCTSFELEEGKNYTISGWASIREDEINFKEIPTLINFDDCKIAVEFFNNGTSLTVNEFSVKGSIIDGWQKIKGEFNVPVGTTDMAIRLVNNSTKAALFDDIRVHPKDGTMKSFVYDAETKKLMAELDENNYATFYEYDIEGGLVRVKKETERGVNTIQETRSNTVKKENND